jgi:hypothetical protein
VGKMAKKVVRGFWGLMTRERRRRNRTEDGWERRGAEVWRLRSLGAGCQLAQPVVHGPLPGHRMDSVGGPGAEYDWR